MKAKCNSWETTNEAAYIDARLQRNPALMANVDEALEKVDETWMSGLPSPESLLRCYNCSTRPKERVHPSLVERPSDELEQSKSQTN